MKNKLLLLVTILVSSMLLFGVSANDIAEAAELLNVPYSELKALVEKHNPSSSEILSPVGTFVPGPSMLNLIIDEILKEEGVDKSSADYMVMRAFYEQLLGSVDLLTLIGMEEDLYLVFTKQNIYFEDETVPYRLDRDTRVVWVEVEGFEIPFGSFDKNYMVFTMVDEPMAVFDLQL